MFSKNTEVSSSTKIRPVGAEMFHADKQTQNADNIRFSQFSEGASKPSSSLPDNETHDNTTASTTLADKITVMRTPELQHLTAPNTQPICRETAVYPDNAHLSLSTAQESSSLLCNQPRAASKAQGPDQEWIRDSVLPGHGLGTSNWAEIVECGFYDICASAVGLRRCS
jgi:hypothetical protein